MSDNNAPTGLLSAEEAILYVQSTLPPGPFFHNKAIAKMQTGQRQESRPNIVWKMKNKALREDWVCPREMCSKVKSFKRLQSAKTEEEKGHIQTEQSEVCCATILKETE